MSTEGCGSSNGVNYTYKVGNNSWFGHCKCNIHRYFLAAGPRRFHTENLSIAGRRWYLEFSHTKDGLFSAHLVLASKSSVKAQFSISVLNHAHPEKDIDKCGGSVLFHPRTSSGDSEMCAIEEIQDRSNGYLFGDSFTVYLKIRQKIPENEEFTLSSHGTSCTATWKLRHVHQLSPTELVSDDFSMGNSKWYLSIHPGDRLARREHVGVYLHSLNEFPIKIAARLTVVNHKSQQKSVTSGVKRVYDGPSGYGFEQILNTMAVQDPSVGFLCKGWVTIVAEIFRCDDDLSLTER